MDTRDEAFRIFLEMMESKNIQTLERIATMQSRMRAVNERMMTVQHFMDAMREERRERAKHSKYADS